MREKEVRLEGIVHAHRYDPNAGGKQFPGVAVECSDGTVAVITYAKESPYHEFTGRDVVVSGEPDDENDGTRQRLFAWRGNRRLRHLRFSTMRLSVVTLSSKWVEIGAAKRLRGQFERLIGEAGDSTLRFINEDGIAFTVCNKLAEATVGPRLEVEAHTMQPGPSTQMPSEHYLWIRAVREA